VNMNFEKSRPHAVHDLPEADTLLCMEIRSDEWR